MSNGSSVLQSGLPFFRHPHPAHFYRDLPLVRISLPITLAIDALPGQTFSGTMHTIDLVVDLARRHVRMRAHRQPEGETQTRLVCPRHGRPRPQGPRCDPGIRPPATEMMNSPLGLTKPRQESGAPDSSACQTALI